MGLMEQFNLRYIKNTNNMDIAIFLNLLIFKKFLRNSFHLQRKYMLLMVI